MRATHLVVALSLSAASALLAPAGRFAALTPLSRTCSLRSVATALPTDTAAAPEAPAWATKLDYPTFRTEVHELGQRLANEQGEADVSHLKKMILWSNLFGAVGIGTMWMSSPLGRLLSVVGLSTWTCTRWTMIGHHICHGGYNRQDDEKYGGTGRFTAQRFAVGSAFRRCRDWLDWMLPEAWNVEHNNLHHYRLGESGDPDLVERNLDLIRNLKAPLPLKYMVVALLAVSWKWYYYAPNTYKQLRVQQMRKEGVKVSEEEAHEAITLPHVLSGKGRDFGMGPMHFMRKVMGPMLLLRFFALPAPLLIFSPAFYWAAVTNLALGDILSNVHAFIIIATNHCGNDMYKFENSCAPRSGTFYMRAVTSSSNFRTANGVGKPVHGFTADLNDFFHGWLNYQVEHHAFPQLSMLSYQKAAPELRAICEKHGVPYIQENVFIRLKKTADIMAGATSMLPFDASWEHEPDRFAWADQK